MNIFYRLRRMSLHYQILIAILLGGLYGYFLTDYLNWIEWMGIYFMNLLKLVVLPLIFFSITVGVASMSGQSSFLRLGGKTLFYYVFTSLIAIVTGLVFVNLIQPGRGVDVSQAMDASVIGAVQNLSLYDIVLGFVPDNLFQAFSSFNILGVIFFAILLGVFLGKSDHPGVPSVKRAFEGLTDVILHMTMAILKLAPIGVFSLIAKSIAQGAADPDSLFRLVESQGVYFLTVVLGILFHAVVTLSLLMRVNGLNPLRHLKNMKEVLIFSFSTASSSATLPLSLNHIQTRSGVSKQLSEFTLPIGVTINMNGTSLYECVAVIFMAQAYGIDLSIGQQVTVVLACLFAGIGTAGIPMGSLVMTVIILQIIGLPMEAIGLVLLVDRFLDMLRSSLNVYSDTVCTLIIAKSEGEVVSHKS